MDRTGFRFFHPLRVRWAEVDMQKIVFNPHYLMYVDTAVGDYWNHLALPYEASMQQLGGDLYVKKSSVEYHASARYDDRLDVGLRCQRIGSASLLMVAGIFRGEQLLASAELVYVFANPATQTSQPVPAALRDALLGYEAGEPMWTLHTGTWAALGPQAAALRTEVFIEEQGIAAEDEWDADDAVSLHAVLLNRLGRPVATGRLLPAQQGQASLGRLAVSRVLRGVGLGRELVKVLCAAAAARGDRCLVLHAQRSAQGFYERLGWRTEGAPFDEVGIPHIGMVRELPAGPAA